MAISLKRSSAKLTKAGWLNALKFGVITGFLMIITLLLAHWLDYKTTEPHFLILDLLLIILMMWACIIYRRQQDNVLSMRQAYLSCVMLGITAAAIFSMFLYVYLTYWHPDFTAKYIEHHDLQIMANENITQEEKINQHRILQSLTPITLTVKTFFDIVLISVFIPLILSLFLKREKQNHSSAHV